MVLAVRIRLFLCSQLLCQEYRYVLTRICLLSIILGLSVLNDRSSSVNGMCERPLLSVSLKEAWEVYIR